MDLKQISALRAFDYLQPGMKLGLGSGSTARLFVQELGARLQSGQLWDIVCVPTSTSTAQLAHELGIPLTTLAEIGMLDLAVDGADETDHDLNLIKGLGKALLREKIVEIHTRDLTIVADEGKLVDRLGQGPLPVEIVPFEHEVTVRWLETLGCRAELWLKEDDQPYVTDNGNFLARCWFAGGIPDLPGLANTLAHRPGVAEHGLFLGMANRLILAGVDGVRVIEK